MYFSVYIFCIDIENFPKEHVWQASIYLTENTFHSLRKMFKSAREIQDWFTQCAQIISSTFYQNVEWITPLGLPVVQPYTKQKFPKKHVKSNELVKVYNFANTYIKLILFFIT